MSAARILVLLSALMLVTAWASITLLRRRTDYSRPLDGSVERHEVESHRPLDRQAIIENGEAFVAAQFDAAAEELLAEFRQRYGDEKPERILAHVIAPKDGRGDLDLHLLIQGKRL